MKNSWPLLLIFALLFTIIFFGIWAEMKNRTAEKPSFSDAIFLNACREISILEKEIHHVENSLPETNMPAETLYRLAGLRNRKARTIHFLKQEAPEQKDCPH